MRRILKKNWIFMVIAAIFVVCLLKKDAYLPMNIVSYVDSWFNLEQGMTLEQTWISEIKEVAEIKVKLKADKSFTAKMKMSVLEEETGEVLSSVEECNYFEKDIEKEVTFHFPSSFNVVPGKQYVIQFKFIDEKDTSSSNKLMIEAGSNYMGCTIEGAKQDGGAAFEIIYIKSSILFWIFVSFFPFFAFSFLFMMLWEKKWEDTIGLSVATGIFVMFVMGLTGHLEQGIFLLYILAVISMVVAVLLYNFQNRNIRDLFSDGFIFFGIVLIGILINCNGLRLARWDEFTHWGLAAKDMFYSNDFAKHAGSTVMLKSYPPVSTLIEYFFCYTNKLYSDHMVYVGFQVLSISLLSVGFSVIKEKRQIIPTAMVLMILPLIFFYDVSNSIYSDPLLAFAVAYILICYYSAEKSTFNFLRIGAGLFVLTLTKDTGVVLAGLLTLVMLGDVLYQQWIEKKINWKQIIISLLEIAWTCILFFTWQIYLKIPVELSTHSGTSLKKVSGAIDNSNISVNGIMGLLRGDDGGYRYQAIKNFIIKIFSDEIFHFDMLSFSFIDLAIIIVLVAIALGIKKNREEEKTKFFSFAILTFIAGLLYCAFLLMTYLFAFSMGEALLVSSFERYSGSWICGILIALCILLIEYTERKTKYNNITLIVLSSFLLIVMPIENLLMLNMDTELTDDMVYGMDDLAQIVKSGARENDKIFFICNSSDGYTRYQFRNAVVPLLCENGDFNVYESEESYKKQREQEPREDIIWRDDVQFVDYVTLRDEILQTEYVVIFHVNEMFKECYGKFFEVEETIDDGTVYKVNKEKEQGFLEYVGKTGIKNFR